LSGELSLTLLSGPATVREAVEGFLRQCRARNLSPRTLELNADVLRRFCEHCGNVAPERLTPDSVLSFLASCGQRTSTARRYHEVLRAFGKYLQTIGLPDPAAGIERPKAPLPVIEPLTQEEVEAMLAACPETPAGLRDRLLLLLLVDCGLRASEVAALDVRDVDLEERVLLVRCGKGGKPRRVPFGRQTAETLAEWLAVRNGLDSPRLFVSCYGAALDRHGVAGIVDRAAKRAGIARHVGPHRLRHTFAISYLRAGGDVFTLQRILGHSTLAMTRRYADVADTDVVEKHRLFSPGDRLELPGKKRQNVLNGGKKR
jgi:site-specific recombinase XerD